MEILTFRQTYWNYYMQLESDFFSYCPYCEIDHCNDNAFSVKYLQLLLSVCGEIDTICKRLCKQLDENLDEESCGIDDYIAILNRSYHTFSQETVSVRNYEYGEIKPWNSIKYGYVPNWWKTYNSIKHHRDKIENGRINYKGANQKTVLSALSALYVLIEYWAAKNFVYESKETEVHIMGDFKSSRLNLDKWNYYSFMGQHPWISKPHFIEYMKGAGKV